MEEFREHLALVLLLRVARVRLPPLLRSSRHPMAAVEVGATTGFSACGISESAWAVHQFACFALSPPLSNSDSCFVLLATAPSGLRKFEA